MNGLGFFYDYDYYYYYISPASQNITAFLIPIVFHRKGVKLCEVPFVKHSQVRGARLDASEKEGGK